MRGQLIKSDMESWTCFTLFGLILFCFLAYFKGYCFVSDPTTVVLAVQ